MRFFQAWSLRLRLFLAMSQPCLNLPLGNCPGVSPYLSALGGEAARPKVDSLLGNLQTKIFHQNGDNVTNHWAAEAIGRKLQYRFSSTLDNQMRVGKLSQPGRFTRLETAHVPVEHEHSLVIVRPLIPFLCVRQIHRLKRCDRRFLFTHEFSAFEPVTNLVIDAVNLIPASRGR